MKRSEGNASCPSEFPDPSFYFWKLICIPHMLWSKAQRETREQEAEKSHSRFWNVFSLTGGVSVKAPDRQAVGLVMTGVAPYQTAFCSSVTVHKDTTTLQYWTHNKITTPQTLIMFLLGRHKRWRIIKWKTTALFLHNAIMRVLKKWGHATLHPQ